MAQWYYLKNGQQHGHISSEQLKQLAASGQLQPTDLVWKEGMKQKVEASKIKGLFVESQAPAPPSAPSSPQPVAPIASPSTAVIPTLWNPIGVGIFGLFLTWGFGAWLLPLLEQRSVVVRSLVRNPRILQHCKPSTQIVRGDVLDIRSLDEAMRGVHTAYYLVHLMSGNTDFEKQDRQAAINFAGSARRAGVRRIIYLGGLGDDANANLSPHLRSRHEVGRILRDSGVETIEVRASIVIGAGSLSFNLIQSLTDRLPVMICPRWLTTPTQPIAVDDVLAYLLAAKDLPAGESRIFEIGGMDVVTYGDLIREYAHQRGLRRWLISVPVLTPYLSSLWLALVTPASFEVGRHLIEGLKNPTVVQDKKALNMFSIRPMGVPAAIQKALAGRES
jgi:uncharacterized protein YbjT (DUF2867 family)